MAAERRVRGADLDHVGRYGDNPAWRLRDLSGWQRKRRRHGSRVRPLRQHVCGGSTKSQNFPLPPLAISTPFQSTLIGTQNAFVSRIGAVSSLLVQTATGSPQPAGGCGWSTGGIYFNITNTGPTPRPTSFFTVPWRRQTAIWLPLPRAKSTPARDPATRKKETLSNASFRHCRRVRWPAWRST